VKSEQFAEEMLEEIENFKDLTKEELPVIAKEYLQYKIVNSILGIISGSVLLILSAIVIIICVNNGRPVGITIGLGVGFTGFCITVLSIDTLLRVILQPHRMAIDSIISLIGKTK